MAVKLPPTDEAKLNMTPMIDMTFLLVVFFMLSIDLTQKEFIPLALPFAYKGVEDKGDEPGQPPRQVMNLTSDGILTYKGERYNLAASDPRTQDTEIERLRNEMRLFTRNPAWREPGGASTVPIYIHGDRNATWQHVQWVMQACAHHTIQIYKLQFGIKNPNPPGSR
jgi:biopolymer transport protein ExbD